MNPVNSIIACLLRGLENRACAQCRLLPNPRSPSIWAKEPAALLKAPVGVRFPGSTRSTSAALHCFCQRNRMEETEFRAIPATSIELLVSLVKAACLCKKFLAFSSRVSAQ